MQKRNSKNTKNLRCWYLNDEVICFGKRGWISGFTGTSSAYIVDGNGQYIQMPNKNYKQVNLSYVTKICHNNTWRYFVVQQNCWNWHSSHHLQRWETSASKELNQTPKYVFGYKLFDKVLCLGQEGFIFGRRSRGYFDIRKLSGEKIHAGISYKKLRLLEHSNYMLIAH